MRIAVITFLAFVHLSIAAQVHQIPRTDEIKTGQKLPVMRTEQLIWGAVDSKCLSEPVKFGKWIALKPKGSTGTLEIQNNQKYKTRVRRGHIWVK
ncbi:MAG: hypothetical protein R2813_06095 [Flavobacteriales bacterium]